MCGRMTATLSKPADRGALIRDASYFADELLKRLDRLAKIDGRRELAWRQAAALVFRARASIRSPR